MHAMSVRLPRRRVQVAIAAACLVLATAVVYASGSLPSQPYEILGADVRLELHKINMSRSVENIESDVAALRQRLIADAAGVVDQVGA